MKGLGKRKSQGEWYVAGAGGGQSPVAWLSDERYARLPAPHRALAWAARAVGEKESGRNRGPFVEHVQERAGLGSGGGFAWCACFVYWGLAQAGVPAGRLPARGESAAVRRWVAVGARIEPGWAGNPVPLGWIGEVALFRAAEVNLAKLAEIERELLWKWSIG